MRYDLSTNRNKTMHLSSNYKHEQLTALLREEISGHSFPNNRFHTVKYLMDHYNVSQATLTRALSPLFEEGILYSVAGKGTFVQEKVPRKSVETTSAGMVFCIVSHKEMFDREYNKLNWFVAQELLAGISEETERRGYQMNLVTMCSDIGAFRHLAEQKNAAFIFLEYNLFEPFVEYCIKRHIPYAVYARHSRVTRNLNQVWMNIEQGQHDIVKYLIGLGHREIAFLGDAEDSFRHRGYRSALRASGIPYRRELCWYDYDGSIEKAQKKTLEMLAKHLSVTAIACSTDMRAAGALEAAKKMGKTIPEFAVTGMDDIWKIYQFPMRPTTMHLPLREIGIELVKLTSGDHSGQCICMTPTLSPGETTCKLKINSKDQ